MNLSICFFVFFLSPVCASPFVSITPGAGVLVDIAPFGVEQYLTEVQCSVSPDIFPYISIKPAYIWNRDVSIVRIPVVLLLPVIRLEKHRTSLSVFAGVGAEFYRTRTHKADSHYLTAGSEICVSVFILELFVSRAYRVFNTDSDFGILAGYRF